MTAEFMVDTAPAELAIGYVDGIAATVQTDKFIGSVVSYAWAKLAPEFDAFLDSLARSDNKSFFHMYEWGETFEENAEMIGNPEARLWKQTLKGRGRDKVASFSFKASVRPTPVDPILLVPGQNSGKVVQEGVHIFYNKAMVMEDGLQITVTPKLAQYLAFVAREEAGAGSDAGARGTNTEGTVAFSAGPVTFIAGGGHATGKFTGAFQEWWSTMAQELFDQNIAPTLSEELATTGNLDSVATKINKAKTFSIKAGAADGAASFEEGRAAGIENMLKLQRNYIAGAAARRSLGGYDIDEL